MSEKVYMVPNPPTPNKAVVFDPVFCTACNSCTDVCPTDVLMPNPEGGKPPIVLYPEECWYCGGLRRGMRIPRGHCHDSSHKPEDIGQLEKKGYRRTVPPGHEEPAAPEQPASIRLEKTTDSS